MHRWGQKNSFPEVVTIFSAPNYCSHQNKGAVILIENDKMNIKQYKEVVQPFKLPSKLNGLTWSLPFLIDKVHEMLEHLLTQSTLKGDLKMAR